MTPLGVLQGIAGGLLLFFVPGYTVTKAVFPEWRVRWHGGARRLVEVVTLSFVTSIGLVVLVGYGILNLASGGFSATWSDPVLEAGLAAVALVAFVVAYFRGAFARVPPTARVPEEVPGDEGAWELSRELDRLARNERRLEHEIRVAGGDPSRSAQLHQELDALRAQREALRNRREEEYAA